MGTEVNGTLPLFRLSVLDDLSLIRTREPDTGVFSSEPQAAEKEQVAGELSWFPPEGSPQL